MVCNMLRFVKCMGFTNGNSDRQTAKRPLIRDWTKSTMTEEEKQSWLSAGGWIGMVVPNDIIVVDVDNLDDSEILDSILNDHGYKYACMKTLKGRQFFFKAPASSIKGATKVKTGLTIEVDYRAGGKNQVIIPPSEACRTWEIEFTDYMELDELPRWLYPIKVSRDEDFDFSTGSRNSALQRHGTRLAQQGYSDEEMAETLGIINEFLLEEPIADDEVATIAEGVKRFKETSDFEPIVTSDYILNAKGNPLICIENVQRFCDSKNIHLSYDELKHTELINGNVFEDVDLTLLWNKLITSGFGISRDSLVPIVSVICRFNKFNPIQDYLKGMYETYKTEFNVDTDFIKEMFDCLKVEDEHELTYPMFRRWFIQTVAIAFNTGSFRAENVLTLQGRQGDFKTTFLKNLSPNIRWVRDGLNLDPKNKDLVAEATDHWIVELGELDSTMKSEQALLKAFFSKSVDILRRPYDRKATTSPRLTSFCASVNKEEFLKDETGNRRYWIIKVDSVDLDKQKLINLDRFWGYCYHLWINNLEISYIKKDELPLLQSQTLQFNNQDEAYLWLDSVTDDNQPEQKIQLIKLHELARQTYPSMTLPRLRNALTAKGIKTSRPNNKKTVHIHMSPLEIQVF